MKITTTEFGTFSNGNKALLFTIFNGKMMLCCTNYGCCITGILLPSKNGGFDDVVLGYSSFIGYINNFSQCIYSFIAEGVKGRSF